MHSGKNESISQSVTDIQGVSSLTGEIKHRDLKQMNNTNKNNSTQHWHGLVPNLGFSLSQVSGDLISAIPRLGADSLVGKVKTHPQSEETACQGKGFFQGHLS